MPSSSSVTHLLSELRNGNQDALNQLLPIVYDELRRLAAFYLSRERPDHTLQATALVHEAYLRLVDYQAQHLQDRPHFFRVAAQVMRHILVDHARGHTRDKRGGGGEKILLDEVIPFAAERPLELLALDEALTALAGIDAKKSQIIELRYFAGLTVEETAEIMELSPATIKREWSLARAWLQREIETH